MFKNILSDIKAEDILKSTTDFTVSNKVINSLYKYFEYELAKIQKQHNSVGWISMQHSADYVELAMYGPGSDLLKPFIKNTGLLNYNYLSFLLLYTFG